MEGRSSVESSGPLSTPSFIIHRKRLNCLDRSFGPETAAGRTLKWTPTIPHPAPGRRAYPEPNHAGQHPVSDPPRGEERVCVRSHPGHGVLW